MLIGIRLFGMNFYHVSDQIGIRFGNATFGKIPPVDSTVRIDLKYTEGNTLLLEKTVPVSD